MNVVLGQLPDEANHRDAVHVAVIAFVAGELLNPGQLVGVCGWEAFSGTIPHIGIVDPFLRKVVMKGEKFWLCLFPGSISTLRHDWTHFHLDDVPLEDYDCCPPPDPIEDCCLE